MLTAVCTFTEHPKNLLECRAAEERAREELAEVRAAAAAAAAEGAHGMDSAVAAAASAVAKAPELRSAVVEAELWRVRRIALTWCCPQGKSCFHVLLTLSQSVHCIPCSSPCNSPCSMSHLQVVLCSCLSDLSPAAPTL